MNHNEGSLQYRGEQERCEKEDRVIGFAFQRDGISVEGERDRRGKWGISLSETLPRRIPRFVSSLISTRFQIHLKAVGTGAQ